MLDGATAAKALMVGLWAIAVPESPSVSVWAQWGLAGVVVAYTLWRDYQREQALRAENKAQDEWVRTHLLQALRESNLKNQGREQ